MWLQPGVRPYRCAAANTGPRAEVAIGRLLTMNRAIGGND